MKWDATLLEWSRKPKHYVISDGLIEIITEPHTYLRQRTYYHFRNDNAPALQIKTDDKFFSFVVKTEFESKHRFDQCGIVVYLDGDNWIKSSVEYENDEIQRLGAVVTIPPRRRNPWLVFVSCVCYPLTSTYVAIIRKLRRSRLA